MQLDNNFFNAHDPGRRPVISNHNLAEHSENQKFIDNMATELLVYAEIQGKAGESCLMNYYLNQTGVLATYGGLVEDIERIAFGSQAKNNDNTSIPAFSDLFSDSEEPEAADAAEDKETEFQFSCQPIQPIYPLGGEVSLLDCSTTDCDSETEKLGTSQEGSKHPQDDTLSVGYTTANPLLQGKISESCSGLVCSSSSLLMPSKRIFKAFTRRGRKTRRGGK
jgi:hypothetical protein